MSGIGFHEALMTLHGGGPVLEVAREVSRILRESGIEGAIIGGVAVGLHGHRRTTIDVDVLITDNVQRFADQLISAGYEFDPSEKQWVKHDVPVHVVTINQVGRAPEHFEEIDGIRTVSCAELINMKLHSGSQNILRAQDLADVIGLIRARHLTKDFTPRIDKSLRPEFQKLVEAIDRERQNDAGPP